MQMDKQVQIKLLALDRALNMQSIAPAEKFTADKLLENAEAIYAFLLDGFDKPQLTVAGPMDIPRTEGN